ncbi:SDR family NAD(P)-dependent oxidoreductase [Acidaminobacter sp. JC074]|uniref:SDR family NAD(P)-dependent oxidoreductase n=1 Tax=Acidaminobacter sp. JC074 TaxID=2530199 RepID=UPI001F0DBF1B|nr:SDR family NAD(P)-dependent oxidoreductase [Acidaminobacter sp. JC074]
MNKVIFITGASSGIGYDAAKALLNEGHTVYGGARRFEKMKSLEKLGVKIIQLDVTDQASMDSAVEKIIYEQGRIDVVFANAGYAQQGPVEMVPIDDIKQQYDVNVFGFARTMKAVLPHMRKDKKGLVLVTSSAAGHVSMPGMAWYPSTKHALDGLVNGMRMELSDFGIDVSILEPGYVNTDFIKPAFEGLNKVEALIEDPIYLRHMTGLRKNFKKSIDGACEVETITKLVLKAVNDKKPKRTYTAGEARLAKFLKKTFGYGLLDGFMVRTTLR